MSQTYHPGLEAMILVGGTDYNAYEISINNEATTSETTSSADFVPGDGVAYYKELATKLTGTIEFSIGYDSQNDFALAFTVGLTVPFVVTKARGAPGHGVSGNCLLKTNNYASGGRDGHGEYKVSATIQGKPNVY